MHFSFSFGIRAFRHTSLLLALCGLTFSAPAKAQDVSARPAPATPPVAAPASPALPQIAQSNPLEQWEETIKAIVRNTRAAVVSIEGHLPTPKLSLNIDKLLLTSRGKDRAREGGDKIGEVSTEAQQEADRENRAAERAILDAQKQLELALGPKVTGSGFLLHGGFVVTTAEVVQGVDQPMVVLADGKRILADWVSKDVASNIAVLKVSGVEPNLGLRWGDSNHLFPGSFALTIGNQSGFANSVALGLVSGTGRSGRSGTRRYTDLIQFQGAVGGGGSGGPLLNSRGDVVGMIVATPANMQRQLMRTMANNADESDSGSEQPALFLFGGVSNTGFALSSNSIQSEVQSLCQRITPSHKASGWLGIRLSDGASDTQGALIDSIYIGSPADHGGILPGDIVTSVNGQPVRSPHDMGIIVREVEAGEALRFEVLRGKSTVTITVTSEPRPSAEKLKQIPIRGLPEQTGALATAWSA